MGSASETKQRCSADIVDFENLRCTESAVLRTMPTMFSKPVHKLQSRRLDIVLALVGLTILWTNLLPDHQAFFQFW